MSKIEWTGKTWNPVIGCAEVSPGCTNCYAARMAYRLATMPYTKERYAGLTSKTAGGKIVWTGKIGLVEDKLLEPVRNKKPTTYFVDSMSDLFYDAVPFDVIAQFYAVMALCPQHTFQILTKRPERAMEFYDWIRDSKRIDEAAEAIIGTTPDLFYVVEQLDIDGKKEGWITNELLLHLKEAGWFWDRKHTEWGTDQELLYDGKIPFPNIWLGVSVEDQKRADERIPYLIGIDAAVKFLSCEPLLGPLDLHAFNWHPDHPSYIGWIIVGGESGPRARPMHPDWAREIRDQCEIAAVPYFFKQWGEYLPACQAAYIDIDLIDNNESKIRKFPSPHNPDKINHYLKLGKACAGSLLDGVEHKAFPANYIPCTE